MPIAPALPLADDDNMPSLETELAAVQGAIYALVVNKVKSVELYGVRYEYHSLKILYARERELLWRLRRRKNGQFDFVDMRS